MLLLDYSGGVRCLGVRQCCDNSQVITRLSTMVRARYRNYYTATDLRNKDELALNWKRVFMDI